MRLSFMQIFVGLALENMNHNGYYYKLQTFFLHIQ